MCLLFSTFNYVLAKQTIFLTTLTSILLPGYTMEIQVLFTNARWFEDWTVPISLETLLHVDTNIFFQYSHNWNIYPYEKKNPLANSLANLQQSCCKVTANSVIANFYHANEVLRQICSKHLSKFSLRQLCSKLLPCKLGLLQSYRNPHLHDKSLLQSCRKLSLHKWSQQLQQASHTANFLRSCCELFAKLLQTFCEVCRKLSAKFLQTFRNIIQNYFSKLSNTITNYYSY